jgi:hypothetical protein
MNAPTAPYPLAAAKAASRGNPARYFQTLAAVLLIVLMLVGFHHFYFQGRAYPAARPITPPIRSLVILHGSAMAAWMVLFLVQPLLILSGNRKAHMRLGVLASFFAAAVVLLGFKLGIESARVKPEGIVQFGMHPKQFMAIPLMSILFFAGFISAAIACRRRPPLHRAFMLTGTLFAISAAVARIDMLTKLYHGTVLERIWGPYFMTVAVAFVLLALKGVLSRSLDRPLALSCVVLAALLALNTELAMTHAWESVATFLLR